VDDLTVNDKNIKDQDLQVLTSWLTAIGMITMYWSPVERSIDHCVHFLHQKSTNKISKPTSLNRKIQFLKARIPKTVVTTEAFERLETSTKHTVQIRDILVHGVINSYDQNKIEIGKINGKFSNHQIEVFTIDHARLQRSAAALSSLGETWSNIAADLHQLVGDA
jgi:hypothetical protein